MYLIMGVGFALGVLLGYILLFALFGMMVYYSSKVKP